MTRSLSILLYYPLIATHPGPEKKYYSLLPLPTGTPVLASTNRLASARPFSTSTNMIATMAVAQIANRKGKPIQLFWVVLMMAWMTLGPIIDDCVVITD